MKTRLLALLDGVLPATAMAVTVMLASCTAPPHMASSLGAGAERVAAAPPAAALGTGWGEARDSHVRETTFERARSAPDMVGKLHYYNAGSDENPARQSGRGFPYRGMKELPGGKVAVGIKGERGSWLRGVDRGGSLSVFGQAGERYEIVLRNLTPHRIEVVVSVDGLDVIDGKSASFSKRGHLIPGRGSVTISGWRTSSASVAAFEFAEVQDSYAARRHGDTRNVGVIGIAAFTEKLPPLRVYALPPPDRPTPNPFPGER